AQVDVRLKPRLQPAPGAPVPALAHPEEEQHGDRRQAERPVGHAGGGAAVGEAAAEPQGGCGEEPQDDDPPPAPARALGAAEHQASPRESARSSISPRHSSGESTRRAAPVGQLRTQAGPPSISRQRSHLTATVWPVAAAGAGSGSKAKSERT